MTLTILSLIGGLLALIPFLVTAMNKRKATRNALAQSEADALKDQLDHPRAEPDPAKRLYLGVPKADR